MSRRLNAAAAALSAGVAYLLFRHTPTPAMQIAPRRQHATPSPMTPAAQAHIVRVLDTVDAGQLIHLSTRHGIGFLRCRYLDDGVGRFVHLRTDNYADVAVPVTSITAITILPDCDPLEVDEELPAAN